MDEMNFSNEFSKNLGNYAKNGRNSGSCGEVIY